MGRRQMGPLVDDAGSWGDALRNYQAEKQRRPMPDEYYAKPPLVTRAMKAKDETSYNPVLQTFTDRAHETASRTYEKDAVIATLNQARDRQIATESSFDILSMRDKRTGLTVGGDPKPRPPPLSEHVEIPQFRHPLDSAYAFNIVSNLPLSEHHYTAPDQRPKITYSKDEEPRLQSIKALPRDFNILSNKYADAHDAKLELEAEINRRTAAKKYWETHDYDLLTAEFVDPIKEQAMQGLAKEREEAQSMLQFNRLPPSMQKGEGYVYDITSHQVKNKDLYDRKQAGEQRWLDSKKINWERESLLTQRGIHQQEVAERRTLNRASHKRYVETYGNGYNIVDHRDYQDRNTYMPPCRAIPPSTVWQNITKAGSSAPNAAAAMTSAPTSAPPSLASGASLGGSTGVVRTGGFQRVEG